MAEKEDIKEDIKNAIIKMRTEKKIQKDESFAFIMKIYWNELCKYVYKITMDRSKTEDIVQEAFIKIYKNIDTLRNIEVFEVWLYRIVRNEVWQDWRKNNKHILVFFEDMDTYYFSSNSKEREQIREAIIEFLNSSNTVSKKEKEAMELHYLKGYDQEDIQQALNVEKRTVRDALYRGREKFKKWWLDNFLSD